MAEKVYRTIFEIKPAQGNTAPALTDIGKQVIAMAQIPINTLYKKNLEVFQTEFADENIADLHYNHHMKRRVKHLLRLSEVIRAIQNGSTY